MSVEAQDITDREPFNMELENPAGDIDENDPNAQGSEAWHAARAGKFTASIFRFLKYDRTPYKTGPRAGTPRDPPESRQREIERVVAERLCGKAVAQVSAKQFDYGHAMEPEAVAAYEARIGEMTEVAGFVVHPRLAFAGCSPDILVGIEGGGEVKCPMSIAVHARTLMEGLPDEHIYQIQGCLWVLGRQWWDFVSYQPEFPGRMQLYVQRVHRDERIIAEIQYETLAAEVEVIHALDDIVGRF